ncbi:MAG: (deoxy)nucleoside triphosphate pyrophosphohydrolase [Spirochaetia bacterium]|nr:(deoxy)nucleoside triphosphate pyrophosphohydrolase [Spirochaetia bacterium]
MAKNIRVVCAIIIDDDKNICIARRCDEALYGLWEFPGGKVEKCESDEQALIREIKEELEVTIEIKNFCMEHVYSFPTIDITLASYLCKSSEKVTHSLVHEKILYLPIEALKSYSFAPPDIKIVDYIIKNSNNL